MREVRRRFHEELRALEGEVQRTGTQAQLLLERALQALARGDPAICDQVIRGDDEVDQLYLDVERRILGLFALQTPVASDLRLLTALLHINLHLERIADQAVNLAKITKSAAGLPPNPKVLQHLEGHCCNERSPFRPPPLGRSTRQIAVTIACFKSFLAASP
jgi:phosphate transport system protein